MPNQLVRMRVQMAESAPSQREQTVSGKEGRKQRESQRDADLQLHESWNVV